MLDRIPGEVLCDILTNPELSLEDVGRCSCVCKSWYSLITSPAFISLHTQQRIHSISKNKNTNSLFLVRTCAPKPYINSIGKERFSLHFDDDDDSFAEYKKSLDFSSSKPPYAIVDCVRGVVCIMNRHTDSIILWNPTIRKCLRLPQPPEVSVSYTRFPLRLIGFGFDITANNFKVVRFSYCFRYKTGARYHVEVFDLSSGCWKSSTCRGGYGGHYDYFHQAFLRGVVHWLAKSLKNKKHGKIVSFDFHDEVFGVMRLPDCPAVMWSTHVLVMGECLSLSYNEYAGHGTMCSIWVMKQYGVADSWTKQYSIDLRPGIHTKPIVVFRKNGGVLFVNSLKGTLSCYDPNKKSFKLLKKLPSGNFDVVNFTESLALLGVKGKLGMPAEAEDGVNYKGSADIHRQKKMKMQSQ